jgi:carbon monoxide dehydrogenase subunit G
MRVSVQTHVEAPPSRVWQVLTDWEAQPHWMVDARAVEVVGDRREGEGTRLRCPTDLALGLVVTDVLEVVEWHPPHMLGVRHTGGLIQGVAAFELHPTAHGTHLCWWEEIDPPLGPLGWVGGLVAVPLVRRVFCRSLARLKRLVEQGGAQARVPPPGQA